MILDNEEQRDLLIQLINGVEFAGTYKNIQYTINKVRDLLKAIDAAKVE